MSGASSSAAASGLGKVLRSVSNTGDKAVQKFIVVLGLLRRRTMICPFPSIAMGI